MQKRENESLRLGECGLLLTEMDDLWARGSWTTSWNKAK